MTPGWGNLSPAAYSPAYAPKECSASDETLLSFRHLSFAKGVDLESAPFVRLPIFVFSCFFFCAALAGCLTACAISPVIRARAAFLC